MTYKNIAFYFVHPSKFHLFRKTINDLIFNGHNIEIYINSKDVLEQLVKKENWTYKNIFPEGRKIKHLSPRISAFINLFRTIFRLFKVLDGKNYDFFVTDDLLCFVGKIKGIKTFLFQDDDLMAVPESSPLLLLSDYILAPKWTDFLYFNKKKIAFSAFKQSAYLHPSVFEPNIEIAKKVFIPNEKENLLIRLVSLKATHDVGRKGISDELLEEIIDRMKSDFNIYICSERPLSKFFNPNLVKLNHFEDILHVLAFSDLFITDSQTMSAEAAFVGTPYIRFNDFIHKISCLEILENQYKLGFGIPTAKKEELFHIIDDFKTKKVNKSIILERRKILLSETINLSEYMFSLFENYPNGLPAIK